MTAWSAWVASRSPYSWYKLDEAAGTTLTDSGASPVNGVTAASNITHNQAGLIPGDAGGKSKTSAAGGQIDTGIIARDAATGWTMYTTYKGTAANVTGNGEWFRQINSNGVTVRIGASDITLTQYGAGTTGWSFGPRTLLLDGTPKFVAWVFKNGDQRLYIGDTAGTLTLAGSQTLNPGVSPTGTSVTRFHRNDGSNFLSGSDDDIVFVSGADTLAQVQAAYDAWLGVSLPGAPTSLGAVPGVTDVDVYWSAPATGTTPDYYEVRLNGGAASNVGLLLAANLSGLTTATLYDTPGAEVRAHNAAGYGPWASVAFTTLSAPPPPSNDDATYWVRIHLGEPGDVLTFDVSSADMVDPDAPLQVLDGLRIGWADASDPWPSHPDMMTATLGLLAWDVSDLANYTTEGTPAEVTVWDGDPESGGVRWLTFAGRITSSTAKIVRRKSMSVSLFTINCADWLLDLAETPVEWAAFPAESIDNRLARIDAGMRAAGLPGLTLSLLFGPTLDAAAYGVTDPLSVLKDTLRQYTPGGGTEWQRWYVKPRTMLGSMAPSDYELAEYESEVPATILPAVFTVIGGILSIRFPGTISGDLTLGLVDSCYVDEAATGWESKKRGNPTLVKVTSPLGVYTARHSEDHPVKLELASTISGAGEEVFVENMADMYLPPLESARTWEVSKFLIYAAHLINGLGVAGGRVREWFPDPTDSYVFSSWPNAPVVVTNVPDTLNLTGDTGLYAGSLKSVELTITGRKVLIEAALRRRLPYARSGADLLTVDYVQATYPTIDVDHVDPTLTVYDTRLVRIP